MSETNEKWSNLEETAEYLGVTKDTIRSWIKKTDIPAHKIGRLWKFKFSEVDEWVKNIESAYTIIYIIANTPNLTSPVILANFIMINPTTQGAINAGINFAISFQK